MKTNVSLRIERLLKRAKTEFSSDSIHMLTRKKESAAYAKIAYKEYSANQRHPETFRRAKFLQRFAREFPIIIRKDELIVGSQAFGPSRVWCEYLSDDELKKMRFHNNNGHIIVDYGRILKTGLNGLQKQIDMLLPKDPLRKINKKAFKLSVKAFSTFIARHGDSAADSARQYTGKRRDELKNIADICKRISKRPPRSFHEALQLVWFIQIFLHTEGGSVAISYGRFDQYLGDFLEKDLADGLLDISTAEELLSCFWIKSCEGDESQNLIIGGIDSSGNNAENILSILCLKVATRLRVWQPSLSVRIGPSTSEDFWCKTVELVRVGIGQPSLFNDPVVTESLEILDIPSKQARDWGIVGCYEATPQGNTYGCTVNGSLVLPELLIRFMAQNDTFITFSSFYNTFLKYVKTIFNDECLENCRKFQENARSFQTSPFESVCLTGCLDSGLTAEENGGEINLLGINVLGLGTLIDSLYAIKKLVYDKKMLSLKKLKKQLDNDFPDKRLLQSCRGLPGKYGSDSKETNRLAKKISQSITNMIINSRLDNGVRPYPAFFRFSGDIYISLPATPDGRKANDRISYGAGPGIYCKNSDITSIMNSVAHIAHNRSGCGAPLIISLNKKDVAGNSGLKRIRQLTETYFKLGAFQVQYNVIDADQLRKAKKDPDQHAELTVRISGYSARFINIPERWQDAIIERTEKSM